MFRDRNIIKFRKRKHYQDKSHRSDCIIRPEDERMSGRICVCCQSTFSNINTNLPSRR